LDREGTGYPMAEQKAKGHEFEILRPGCSQDGEGIPEVAYEHYLTALLAGDRRFCQATVETLLDQRVPIRRIYEELFGRSLYRVGELWERGTSRHRTHRVANDPGVPTAVRRSTYPPLGCRIVCRP
jgi:hypothetical protein